MIRKGQIEGVGKGDIGGQVEFIEHLFAQLCENPTWKPRLSTLDAFYNKTVDL